MYVKPLTKSTAQKSFENAFLALYQEKGLNNFSVTQLISKAHYTRATFYRYFNNLDEVLASIELENTCSKPCADIVSNASSIPLEEATDMMASFFQDRYDVISILIKGDHGIDYLEQQRLCMKPMFSALIQRGYNLTPMQLNFASEYIASAKIGMLRLWVDSNNKISLNQLNKMAENVFESSIWTHIAEAANNDAEKLSFPDPSFEYPWIKKIKQER